MTTASVEHQGRCAFCGAKALILIEDDDGPLVITGEPRAIPGALSVAHEQPMCERFKRALANRQPCFIVERSS